MWPRHWKFSETPGILPFIEMGAKFSRSYGMDLCLISFATLRATGMCIRESRTKWRSLDDGELFVFILCVYVYVTKFYKADHNYKIKLTPSVHLTFDPQHYFNYLRL